MRSQALYHGSPLIRTSRAEAIEAGIICVPRISGTQNGNLLLADGRTLPVEGVVWATGYRPNYSWINLPVFDDHGLPQHQRGIVQKVPGLYFVGLHFQTALNSALLGGVGRDAHYIVDQLTENGELA